MDLFTFIALLVFRPTHASRYWAYGFSVLLGSADGTWQPIIAVTIALYFPDRTELAFGAITLWKVLAMAAGFVMSGRMCLSIRIYLLIGNLVLAWFCSAVAEKRRRTRTAEE
uniref:Protein unc-93 homolog A n=1 Tax=Ciona savignyi TaxID=51511 RepID=H2YX55_CIOSA